MWVAVAADERVGIAGVLIEALRTRGHEVVALGALARGQPVDGGERTPAEEDEGGAGPAAQRAGMRGGGDSAIQGDRTRGGGGEDSMAPRDGAWAWASEEAARAVAERRVEQAVVCCWTGTGASIAANKVAGVRAALCADAATAAGARRWNDANVLALSLRCTSEGELQEILDAWFATEASGVVEDRENVAHLAEIERRETGVVGRREQQ